MRVRVDQSGKNGRAGKINRFRVGGDSGGPVRNFLNPVAAHENQLVLPRGLALPVNQRSRANHRQWKGFRFLRLRISIRGAQPDEQEEQSKACHTRSILFVQSVFGSNVEAGYVPNRFAWMRV